MTKKKQDYKLTLKNYIEKFHSLPEPEKDMAIVVFTWRQIAELVINEQPESQLLINKINKILN